MDLAESTAYAVWIGCVDRNIQKRVGLVHSARDEGTYQAWYQDGYTPMMAAEEAVKLAALTGKVA